MIERPSLSVYVLRTDFLLVLVRSGGLLYFIGDVGGLSDSLVSFDLLDIGEVYGESKFILFTILELPFGKKFCLLLMYTLSRLWTELTVLAIGEACNFG